MGKSDDATKLWRCGKVNKENGDIKKILNEYRKDGYRC